MISDYQDIYTIAASAKSVLDKYIRSGLVRMPQHRPLFKPDADEIRARTREAMRRLRAHRKASGLTSEGQPLKRQYMYLTGMTEEQKRERCLKQKRDRYHIRMADPEKREHIRKKNREWYWRNHGTECAAMRRRYVNRKSKQVLS